MPTIDTKSMHPATAPVSPATTRITPRTARVIAACAAAAPALCHAEAGELGGVAMVAVAALAAGWLLLTAFLFIMLRRVRTRIRYAATLLFFAAPFLWLAATFAWFSMTDPGRFTPAHAYTAREPVQMGGATFPAGSQVQNAPSSRRGAHEPGSVTSDTPVALGALSVRGISHHDGDEANVYDVALAFEQTIDGWPCAAVTDIGTIVTIDDVHAPKPQLRQCRLARTVTIGDVAWPPATVVARGSGEKGWSLLWYRSTYTQVERAKGFAFDVESMNGDYDDARKLTAWQGTLAADGDVAVGSVNFAGNPRPSLVWQTDGTVRVTGRKAGQAGAGAASDADADADAAEAEGCVVVSMRSKPRYRECAAGAASDTQATSAAENKS